MKFRQSCDSKVQVYYEGHKTLIKFIYSEKATKFCEIFPLLLTVCTAVKSKGKISQNFVAFSEYMNFTSHSGKFLTASSSFDEDTLMITGK